MALVNANYPFLVHKDEKSSRGIAWHHRINTLNKVITVISY